LLGIAQELITDASLTFHGL